jgi:hypothetical protein
MFRNLSFTCYFASILLVSSPASAEPNVTCSYGSPQAWDQISLMYVRKGAVFPTASVQAPENNCLLRADRYIIRGPLAGFSTRQEGAPSAAPVSPCPDRSGNL